MKILEYKPIGIVRSPFKKTEEMPIQARAAGGVMGTVEVLPEYEVGLKDLEGFSHIILLYHFHQVSETKLIVTPFLDTQEHGIFATRAPSRPNPVGLSILKLLERKANLLEVENLDIVDGTPVLDIKPYVAEFDSPNADRFGWLGRNRHRVHRMKSDQRFR
jgi:tRNA-Thr(GGU) m(6)t(6)A37 methyltransferase TsaA